MEAGANAVALTDARGLTSAEVSARIAAGQVNHADDSSSRSLLQIIRANVFTLFNAILGAAFVVVLLVGKIQDAAFGIVVIVNSAIGVFQEIRAKRTLDRLAVLNAPVARVLRDGEPGTVGVRDVVLDDVIEIRTGDQIPADSKVITSSGLALDESLLTGESDAIAKGPDEEVLSGSFVVAGSGTAQVVRVGADGFAQQITAEAKKFTMFRSELRDGINRILLYITWLIGPLILLLINSQLRSAGGWRHAFDSGHWRDAVVSAVAGIVGMVPEGLVLLTSISFMLAAVTLARRQVLVQELAAVEGLARVDVVCLDKTGTLTEGEIVFDRVEQLPGADGMPWKTPLAVLAADPNANSTARALAPAFPADDGLPAVVSEVSFSSSRKWSSISLADGRSWVFGAPEMVLASRSARYAAAREKADSLARTGTRTLVLASSDEPLRDETLPDGLTPVALICFREKIRPDAAETMRYFREQGVSLKVISGDNPRTVSAVAREVGFADVGSGFDARQLPADPDELADVLEQNTVFGRVTPHQKRDIVHALQRRGHVVAMTGDGVNDALALKDADIGVAMGSGAAATRAVARLVLLDGQFSRMPGVVAEGRRVIANVERVANLYLTKTTYAVVLAIVIGITAWTYPFLPRHLTVVSSLTIGIPSFFLAIAPNKRRYVPGFLNRVLSFAIPCGVIAGGTTLVVYGLCRLNTGLDESRTAASITLFCIGWWVLVVLTRPLNWWRGILVGVMPVIFLGFLTVPLMKRYYEPVLPSGYALAVTLIGAAAGMVLIEVAYRIVSPLVRRRITRALAD